MVPDSYQMGTGAIGSPGTSACGPELLGSVSNLDGTHHPLLLGVGFGRLKPGGRGGRVTTAGMGSDRCAQKAKREVES